LAAEAPWRRAYPFASQWLPLCDGAIHFVDERPADAAVAPVDAPVLLFVHGNPTWSFHWRRMIATLSQRVRCVAIDHLGCGLSDVPRRPLALADRIGHLVQMVERLQLRRIVLVAQDWGGAIGLGAMLQQPGRFQRIVLYNTGAFPPWFVPARIRVCRWPGIGRLAVQGGNAFSRAALRMTLARHKRLEPAVAAGYLAPYCTWRRRSAVYQFVRDIPTSPRHPTWDTLAEIEQGLQTMKPLPTRLIWGDRDWCFTTACRDKFAAMWPHAEVQQLGDVGHWVVEDAPDEALRGLAEFIEPLVPDPPHA
jgi:haloalkane dehalogenase